MVSILRLLSIASLAVAMTINAARADDDTTTITAEGVVDAPAAEVWKVFSTAEGFKKLGVAQAKIDFKPGGMLWTAYDPAAELGSPQSIGTEILAIDPGRVLATRIKQPPTGFPFMEAYKTVTTVISLTDLGGNRTHVRVTMSGYDDSEESQKMREFFAHGNEFTIKTLQQSFGAAVEKGPAHEAGPLDPIELTATIDAPRHKVYQAYTTAEGWKAFFNMDANIGHLPGEAFVPFPGTEGNTILAMVPDEMYSYTWNAPPKFAYAKEHRTWVVITFDDLSPTTTKLRVRHLGFAERAAESAEHADEFKQCRVYFSQAWPKVLGALEGHFEKAGE